MTFGRRIWSAGVALASVLALSACSGSLDPDVVGIWEAEDVRVDSLSIQLGPRLEIRPTEVFMPGPDVRMPIEAIEREARDKVTLRFAPGGLVPRLGWTLHFDSSDRIRMDIPLMGSVYYRRVKQSVVAQPASAPPQIVSPATAAVSVPPAIVVAPSMPETTPATATSATVLTPPSTSVTGRVALLDMAVVSLQRDDADGALRLLGDALGTGAIQWGAVEQEPRLLTLRQDVRYQALMGRYR